MDLVRFSFHCRVVSSPECRKAGWQPDAMLNDTFVSLYLTPCLDQFWPWSESPLQICLHHWQTQVTLNIPRSIPLLLFPFFSFPGVKADGRAYARAYAHASMLLLGTRLFEDVAFQSVGFFIIYHLPGTNVHCAGSFLYPSWLEFTCVGWLDPVSSLIVTVPCLLSVLYKRESRPAINYLKEKNLEIRACTSHDVLCPC